MSNSVSLQHLTESGKSSLREHKAEGGTGNYVKETLSAAGEMAFWGNGPLLTLMFRNREKGTHYFHTVISQSRGC